MTNENMNTRTGNLTKLGMKRANTARENGYDVYTIAGVLDVTPECVADFFSR